MPDGDSSWILVNQFCQPGLKIIFLNVFDICSLLHLGLDLKYFLNAVDESVNGNEIIFRNWTIFKHEAFFFNKVETNLEILKLLPGQIIKTTDSIYTQNLMDGNRDRDHKKAKITPKAKKHPRISMP
jgi:hypothetical protein